MTTRRVIRGAAAVVLAAALLTLGAAPLAAQGRGWRGEGGPGQTPFGRLLGGQFGRLLQLPEQLDLTDEQRAEIRGILEAHRTEIAGAVAPLVEKKRALHQAVAAAAPDEAAIRAAASELGRAIGETAILASGIRTEMRAVLTPEQLVRLDDTRGQCQRAVDRWIARQAGGR